MEIDIAVDVDGYVEDGRPGIFATRPAPIQVNFGYPATMGAEFIDYIIADRTVLPFDQQKLVTEKIVHLPECHQPIDKKPELAPELQDCTADVRRVDAAVVTQRRQRAVAVAGKR